MFLGKVSRSTRRPLVGKARRTPFTLKHSRRLRRRIRSENVVPAHSVENVKTL